MYRSFSSLRAPANRTLPMRIACLLLILFTIATVLHVHNDSNLTASRPCPVCVAIHCAMVVAVLIIASAQASRPWQSRRATCQRVFPLFASDLFVRPPPVV